MLACVLFTTKLYLFTWSQKKRVDSLVSSQSLYIPADGIFIISNWSQTVVEETCIEDKTESNEDQSSIYQPNSPLLFTSPEPDHVDEKPALSVSPMQLHTIGFKH